MVIKDKTDFIALRIFCVQYFYETDDKETGKLVIEVSPLFYRPTDVVNL